MLYSSALQKDGGQASSSVLSMFAGLSKKKIVVERPTKLVCAGVGGGRRLPSKGVDQQAISPGDRQ